MDSFAKETLPISLEEEMRRSYLDYAMSVIVGRALPDVRDGLKPVHRRVLFAMHELNNDWNRAYKNPHVLLVMLSVNIILMAIRRYTIPSCVWPRTSRCVTCWSMGRATLALSTAIVPRPCVTRKSVLPGLLTNCWPTSIRKRLISAPTMTAVNKSRSCCLPGYPICWLTAVRALRLVWPPIFLPITCPKWLTGVCFVCVIRTAVSMS